MFIDETYKRRVRIEGKLDGFSGFQVRIYDIDTGKTLDNVTGAMIYLCPGELNRADLTYYKYTEQGDVAVNPDDCYEPIMGTVHINNPEIAVSVHERLDDAESLVDLLPFPRHIYYGHRRHT